MIVYHFSPHWSTPFCIYFCIAAGSPSWLPAHIFFPLGSKPASQWLLAMVPHNGASQSRLTMAPRNHASQWRLAITNFFQLHIKTLKFQPSIFFHCENKPIIALLLTAFRQNEPVFLLKHGYFHKLFSSPLWNPCATRLQNQAWFFSWLYDGADM